ncbi:SH3 domain-containing protein [Parachitinimonas caeni]|uniref:SH3 domain-containing protein n=1 Tax=Parachitinimonas caeni TaxID=3031301 RepID=A0ABT7E255_9NEIS|nr:SH3 domain-containing protein [Parachitinimonas caeni]MDK2126390.1 SH3 domain-containing protein [Parachitinimonas caeni]
MHLNQRQLMGALVCLAMGHWVPGYAADARFIAGSWVNLREAPSDSAKVLGQWVINTPVTLLSEQGRFCEVSAEGRQGFIACRLLSEHKTRLEEVDAHLADGTDNPKADPTKAFWLDPTVERLFDAGEWFWGKMLSPKQQAKERPLQYGSEQDKADVSAGKYRDKPTPLVRFAIPEFEAMKDLLKKGRVFPVKAEGAPVPFETFMAQQAEADKRRQPWEVSYPSVNYKLAILAGKSVFAGERDLAPPSFSVQQCSGWFSLPARIKSVTAPRYLNAYWLEVDARYSGGWDVGSVKFGLDASVHEYRIWPDGTVTRHRFEPQDEITRGVERACVDLPRYGESLAGKEPEYDSKGKVPLLWFVSPKLFEFSKKAQITRRKIKQESGYVEVFDVDLNQDRIPDLSLWRQVAVTVIVGDVDAVQKTLFANVSGRWWWLDTRTLTECT